MAGLRKFLIISFVCHLVLVLAMVEVDWGGRKVDPAAFYEVEIVAGVPGTPAGAGAPESASGPGSRRFVYTRGAQAPTLGEVRKEAGARDHAPEISPGDIRPETPAEAPSVPDALDLIRGQARPGPGAGAPRGPAGGTPSEIALWKGRVRTMVESLWRMPPEIEVMDASLQTTYLLRIGRDGELLQKKLLVSSGTVPFDRSVLVALGRITRFPQPPLALIAGQDWVEVTMSFTPPKGAP